MNASAIIQTQIQQINVYTNMIQQCNYMYTHTNI